MVEAITVFEELEIAYSRRDSIIIVSGDIYKKISILTYECLEFHKANQSQIFTQAGITATGVAGWFFPVSWVATGALLTKSYFHNKSYEKVRDKYFENDYAHLMDGILAYYDIGVDDGEAIAFHKK